MKLIRLPHVCQMVGIGRSQVYAYMKRGEFPQPAKAGKASLWSEPEVLAWIEERLAQRAPQATGA